MKTIKLFAIDVDKVKAKNIGTLNPTCKAMVKTLYKLSKDEDFEGISGDDLLRECISNGTWQTTQEDSKLHTTFAFYKKKLMKEFDVYVVSEIPVSHVDEFLE